MAYSASNPPMLKDKAVGHKGQSWRYETTDVHTAVDEVNYFTNGQQLGMRLGDVVEVVETDNSYALTMHSVTTLSTTSDGVTVSARVTS